MILALWAWIMVADAPQALKRKVEFKPVLLQNGVEFRPSPTGFTFVKNGKMLKQYTYQELGGVPEGPVCQEPTVRDFGNGTVFVGYCLSYEGPESAGGYVGCYFTDEGEKNGVPWDRLKICLKPIHSEDFSLGALGCGNWIRCMCSRRKGA